MRRALLALVAALVLAGCGAEGGDRRGPQDCAPSAARYAATVQSAVDDGRDRLGLESVVVAESDVDGWLDWVRFEDNEHASESALADTVALDLSIGYDMPEDSPETRSTALRIVSAARVVDNCLDRF